LVAADQSINLGRASTVKSLRPFAPVACKLVGLISEETADFREVSRILAIDAAFSSQVLRLANSALCGRRFEITTLLQALAVVGADRLRDIVVTVALRDYVGNGNNALMQRCWRHNLATAFWSEILAQDCNVETPLGYTAGILHDIGRIALMMLFPHDYAALMAGSRNGEPSNLEMERKLCDVDHCQIGHNLSVAWNFPPILGDVIAHHHQEVTPGTPPVRRLVEAACMAADMNGFYTVGTGVDWEPERIERLLLLTGDSPGIQFENLAEEIVRKVNQTECSLL